MPLRKFPQPPDFPQSLDNFRRLGFSVSESGGRARVERDGCVAEIAPVKRPGQKTGIFGHPSVLVGGKAAVLVDRGYQKFFRTPDLEVPATADKLKALHRFEAAIAQAVGHDQLYNEALGTVSDKYLYDRVKGRADEKPA